MTEVRAVHGPRTVEHIREAVESVEAAYPTAPESHQKKLVDELDTLAEGLLDDQTPTGMGLRATVKQLTDEHAPGRALPADDADPGA